MPRVTQWTCRARLSSESSKKRRALADFCQQCVPSFGNNCQNKFCLQSWTHWPCIRTAEVNKALMWKNVKPISIRSTIEIFIQNISTCCLSTQIGPLPQDGGHQTLKHFSTLKTFKVKYVYNNSTKIIKHTTWQPGMRPTTVMVGGGGTPHQDKNVFTCW